MTYCFWSRSCPVAFSPVPFSDTSHLSRHLLAPVYGPYALAGQERKEGEEIVATKLLKMSGNGSETNNSGAAPDDPRRGVKRSPQHAVQQEGCHGNKMSGKTLERMKLQRELFRMQVNDGEKQKNRRLRRAMAAKGKHPVTRPSAERIHSQHSSHPHVQRLLHEPDARYLLEQERARLLSIRTSDNSFPFSGASLGQYAVSPTTFARAGGSQPPFLRPSMSTLHCQGHDPTLNRHCTCRECSLARFENLTSKQQRAHLRSPANIGMPFHNVGSQINDNIPTLQMANQPKRKKVRFDV